MYVIRIRYPLQCKLQKFISFNSSKFGLKSRSYQQLLELGRNQPSNNNKTYKFYSRERNQFKFSSVITVCCRNTFLRVTIYELILISTWYINLYFVGMYLCGHYQFIWWNEANAVSNEFEDIVKIHAHWTREDMEIQILTVPYLPKIVSIAMSINQVVKRPTKRRNISNYYLNDIVISEYL